eukprot:7805425-Pyramimonas_sp.AAC.1
MEPPWAARKETLLPEMPQEPKNPPTIFQRHPDTPRRNQEASGSGYSAHLFTPFAPRGKGRPRARGPGPR